MVRTRNSSRLLKKGGGAALRAPRGRLQGDATQAMPSHRRGAATPQTAPRRRNLWWTAFCTRPFSSTEFSTDERLLGQWIAKGRTRRPHPFFSSLLVSFAHEDRSPGKPLFSRPDEPIELRHRSESAREPH